MNYTGIDGFCVKTWLKQMTELAASQSTKHIQLFFKSSGVALYVGQPTAKAKPHDTLPDEAATAIYEGILDLSHDPDKARNEMSAKGVCSTDIQRSVLGNCGYHIMFNQIGPSQKIITITATLTDSEVAEMKEACAKKHQTVEQINAQGLKLAGEHSPGDLEKQVNDSLKG